jgi:sirohydrochlorin ferrochelatase
MSSSSPRLLVVAHGTASAQGSATTARLVESIRAARPEIPVERCFLDVAEPRLPDALAALGGPTVLVPLLLSTGYHVQSDIPAAVSACPDVQVARHLGPHPLLVEALVDRLGTPSPPDSVVLVGAGSTRSGAAAELIETGRMLSRRLGGRPVEVVTLGDDLPARFATLPRPVAAATYLLAEGQFVDTLRAAVAGVGRAAAPLGVHPALVALVWSRYDEVRAAEQVR